jgi:dolichyl-phosphate-mannose--protein O-mannosyl transferase
MGRVTYVHHYVRPFSFCSRLSLTCVYQLPTLYFAVLMFAHMVDHFVLTARTLSERAKWGVYGAVVFAIVANFWWFRGMALGIDGPINDYWGVGWRKVRCAATAARADTDRHAADLELLRGVDADVYLSVNAMLFRTRF